MAGYDTPQRNVLLQPNHVVSITSAVDRMKIYRFLF